MGLRRKRDGKGKRAGCHVDFWVGVGEFPELAFGYDRRGSVQTPRVQS